MQSGAGLVRGAVVATDNGQPVSNIFTSFSTCKEKNDNTEILLIPFNSHLYRAFLLDYVRKMSKTKLQPSIARQAVAWLLLSFSPFLGLKECTVMNVIFIQRVIQL